MSVRILEIAPEVSRGKCEMIDLTPDWIYLHSAPYPARIQISGRRGPDTVTVDRLRDRSARLAGALDDLGVCRGDRVATLVNSDLPLLEILLACARVGAVMVPLDPDLSEMDLSMATADSAPSVLLYERSFVAGAWAAASGADCMLVTVDAGDGVKSQYDALMDADSAFPVPVSADHPWVIMYQSHQGSALEKTVLAHGTILRDSLRAALVWASSGKNGPQNPAPLVHAGRFDVCLLASLLYGADEDMLPAASGRPSTEYEGLSPNRSSPAYPYGCSSFPAYMKQ